MNRIKTIETISYMIKSQYEKEAYNWEQQAATQIFNYLFKYTERKHFYLDKDFDFIIKIVYNYFGIDIRNLYLKCRKKEILIPRQVAQYFVFNYNNELIKSKNCRSKGKYSEQYIAGLMGGQRHANLLHSIKTIENRIETEPIFKEDIKKIENLINNELNKPIKYQSLFRIIIKKLF